MRLTGAILLAGLLLATTPALGQDPSVEMRGAARMIAGVERALEKRDPPGYCELLYGGPTYRSYLSRVCEGAIRNNVVEGEVCSDAKIEQEIKKTLDGCLAMTPDALEKTNLGWRAVREKFVKDSGDNGVDGELLLREERAKLR